MTVAFIAIGIVAAIALLFVFLNWRTAKTYKPTKAEVLEILDAVLAGRVTYLQWDTFICVPIRHDPGLEAVRLRCVAMEDEPTLFANDHKEWPGFSTLGLLRIREMRNELAGIQ
jgi:uncharacterized membrane protein YgaE (UPF0421/DUF939 family)